MRQSFEDAKHLIRAGLLYVAGFLAFLVLRGFLVPEGFGAFGHYRSGALDDARARPLFHAGRAACESCHTEPAQALREGAHAKLGCEACHGPLAQHASDPGAMVPVRPEPRALCPVCHASNVAKPQGFPQVDVREHAGDESCATCHAPHHPNPS